ncbi:hypothetical protein BJV82DRAFT_195821 [Fennellomyces sp. T-0311]|nr:hypothetical protein BJV82DRAFT_195821 [Fennellomyces sp. T-0311]
MSTSLTAIILDGHPAAFGPTTRDHDPSIDRTQLLPPIPWWTCMVDSTLEFCRIGWDTASTELPKIAVIAAGETPRYLMTPGQAGQADKLVEEFKQVQPRQVYTYDRIQAALNTLLSDRQTQSFQSVRIILVLVSKNANESKYSHYNNEDSKWRDVRAMVHTASQAANHIESIHTDVLRLFPRQDNLLPAVNQVSYAAGGTLSIHNIPNHQDALKSTMCHLAQLYYNIDVLRISNIPMNVRRPDGSAAMTQTVDLYAQCADGCNQDNRADTNVPIYDPRYLQSKVIQLGYVKRSKRVAHDMGWCTCRHSVGPVIDDGPTKAYLGTMRNGSVSYLVHLEKKSKKEWTHTLLADHDKVFLHVLNDRLEDELAEKMQAAIAKTKVKPEYPVGPLPMVTPDKVQEFLQSFVHPNANTNISHLTPTNTYNPFEYSAATPLLALSTSNQATPTTFNIEHATKWHTCFRDCMGTDKFPVTLADNRPICDLAADVCNGSPLHSGFSLSGMLSVPLGASLAKIKSALLASEVPNLKAVTAEVDIVVNHLSLVLSGKSTKPVCSVKMFKEDSQLMAKRLLIGLYLVGIRFFTFRSAICDYMLQTINDKTTTRVEEESSSSNNESKESTSVIDSAWNQAKKFEGMTVREQEDSRYTLGTGIATAPVKEENPMVRQRRGRGGRGNVSVNPNFRRDGGDVGVVNRKRQADASVAVPYLLAEVANDPPRQIQQPQQEQFGPPNSLLHLYWTVDKQLREGKRAGDDGKVLVFRNNKWQRIQKEFDGRMPHKK